MADIVADRLAVALTVATNEAAFSRAGTALTGLEAHFTGVQATAIDAGGALGPALARPLDDTRGRMDALSDALQQTQIELDATAADADRLGRELVETERRAEGAAKGMAKLRGDAVAAARGAAAGIGALTAGMLALASSVQQASSAAQGLGLTLQEYEGYAYAAGQASVQVTELSGAFGSLTGQLRAASEGNEDAARLFNRLGVSVRNADGTLKTAGQAFPALADGLRSVQDEGLRATLRMQALGEGGAKLEPLLKLGSQGLAEVSAEAHRLGAITSPEAEDAAGRLGAATGRLSATVRGGLLRALEATEPAITGIADALTELAQSPLLLAAGGVAALTAGLAALGVTLNPVTITLGALAATLGAWVVVYDEFKTTAEGGDSVLRRMADTLGIGEDVVYALEGSFRLLSATMDFAWSHASRLVEALGALLDIASRLASLVMPDWLADLGSDLLGMVPRAGGALLHASADLITASDRGLAAVQSATMGAYQSAVAPPPPNQTDNRVITVNVAATDARPEDIAAAIAAAGGG